MAGMLPGVECARRRRFHQGGSSDSSMGSRRSSFCLYTTSHDSHLNSNSNSKQRSGSLNKEFHALALGSIAREAKERLDERLRAQRTSEIKRYKSMESIKINKNESGSGSVHREVFCSKKSARKFSWMKLGWKRSEEDECVVCLEEFKRGDILVHLPCLHRFHWTCVVPWIEANSHCPCCRTSVSLASLESC
ncbi:probable E3 ubiquitin-protein ligase RHY1A [Dioscorea cayenensis subsp. rotundata]|uniref:RING-type E3 ubiquitin transferase n=1 Tax=Dioscorea cayennensis subsp. rotundata TaxID=55577 RepID=A0AB40B0A1_DIOCR|nr:probable E3 ubiquitin-protein ligase RHY1A [Dioscorea cayenensis subsp. rotundata]XP_039120474.1 probable E3 ubiquitin-protein ligase RHY1A [Dioscorea cayenensis subsp. rotundata]